MEHIITTARVTGRVLTISESSDSIATTPQRVNIAHIYNVDILNQKKPKTGSDRTHKNAQDT
jgi:hypothetical protein